MSSLSIVLWPFQFLHQKNLFFIENTYLVYKKLQRLEYFSNSLNITSSDILNAHDSGPNFLMSKTEQTPLTTQEEIK